MILMFLLVQGLVDLLINLEDLILNHIRQISLDFRQDYLQLLHCWWRKNKSGGSIA